MVYEAFTSCKFYDIIWLLVSSFTKQQTVRYSGQRREGQNEEDAVVNRVLGSCLRRSGAGTGDSVGIHPNQPRGLVLQGSGGPSGDDHRRQSRHGSSNVCRASSDTDSVRVRGPDLERQCLWPSDTARFLSDV